MCIWFESSYWINCFSWWLQNRSPEAEHILIALPLLDFPHFPVSSDFHFISISHWEPFFTVYFIFHISYRMSLRTNCKLGFSFHLWFTAKEQIILVFFKSVGKYKYSMESVHWFFNAGIIWRLGQKLTLISNSTCLTNIFFYTISIIFFTSHWWIPLTLKAFLKVCMQRQYCWFW